MFRYAILPVLAAASLATPALAQEEENALFTGFRVEGLAGYDSASFDSVRDGNGFLYGVGVGYDLRAGRVRLGLEGEATDSTAKDCQISIAGQLCGRMGRDLYVGARVGFVVSPSVLLYGKAGYTNGRETNRFTPAGGGAEIVTHPEFDGFRLGGGAELALGRNAFIKGEYRFSNYERSQSFNKHQGVVGFGFRF